MAEPIQQPKVPQPKAGDQILQTACGFQQIGNEMFVVIQMGTGMIASTLVLQVEAAKAFSRSIKDAAETAEVHVLKPPSMLS